MDKEKKLQSLLRLKRHEQPPEGFAEEFLEKFQRRQRTELVRRSAVSILWERAQVWMEGLRRPVVIWSAAGAYAALMLGLWLIPRPPSQTSVTMLVATGDSNAPKVSFPKEPSRSIPVQHTNGVEIPSVKIPPGKNRTSDQPLEKKDIIGPEVPPDKIPLPPLREL